MNIVGLQRSASPILVPYTDEDYAFVSELKQNQIIEVSPRLAKNALKQRSYKQLCLLMAAIRVVVANSEDPNWSTVANAKLSLKVLLNYVDESACVWDERNQRHVLQYRSFGYEDLMHMEACRIFEQAFLILAQAIGVDVEELIDMAKRREYPSNLM